MRLYLLLFFTFIISMTGVEAQSFYVKGWIVTKQGDTLRGYIADESLKELSKEVLYKADIKAKVQKFNPYTCKSFFLYPNQYFESHSVTINDPEGCRKNDVQHFLYRSEAGYVNLFVYVPKKVVFIKKHNDLTLTPLYFTVTTKDEKENKKVDTLTNSSLNNYGSGRLGLGYQYIHTLSKFFNEEQSYVLGEFPLDESRIVYEVKKYNNTFYPQFQTEPIAIKEKWKPVWAIGVGYVSPVNSQKFLENRYFDNNITPESLTNKGYEILLGVYGKKRMKGISAEVGYSRLSNIKYSYTFTNTDAFGNKQITDGHFDSKAHSIIYRLNYTPFIASKVSPYFSMIVLHTFERTNKYQVIRGTSVRQDIFDNYLIKELSYFQTIGLQYSPLRQHVIRTEWNFNFADLKFRYSFVRLGYQYRFWR